ncbi:hypothetical protein [Williamsia sp.]|uniref:hypothetical protein n=1 Tax=Williamsia sp. TaxID=1872085 RepID=UPI002F9464F1
METAVPGGQAVTTGIFYASLAIALLLGLFGLFAAQSTRDYYKRRTLLVSAAGSSLLFLGSAFLYRFATETTEPLNMGAWLLTWAVITTMLIAIAAWAIATFSPSSSNNRPASDRKLR